MFIPGILISLVTFPGVIVHEIAHQLFCRWMKVAVFKVCYFQVDNPVGYVIHEQPGKIYQNIPISMGPFFVNTVLGFIIAFPASLAFKFGTANPLDFLLMYLGVSIAMHAFPSTGDANSMWAAIMKNEESPFLLKIITAPLACLIYLGAAGSVFWLDLLYGIAVCLWLPWGIIHLLA